MDTWESVSRLFDKANARNALILCHRNADPDALSSAHSIRSLILESCSSVKQVGIVAEGINQLSKRMIETYSEIKVLDEITFKPDVFVLVDVNNIIHVGKFTSTVNRLRSPIVIIDHHVPQAKPNENVTVKIIDEEASSTAEIACLLSESIGRTPSRTEATILLAGIIYDSKRFLRIGRKAFYAANYLVNVGADYKGALSVLRGTTERSEKIARLKAAQRAKVVKINGWLIACSTVSSFGASACRALIELGADVAVVASENKKEQRISARSSNAFYEATGANLAKLMEETGRELGGNGGGHPTAATVSGIGDTDKGEKLILRYIEVQIRERRAE